MDTGSHLGSESPPHSSFSLWNTTEDSLEQFLHSFFTRHMLNDITQTSIRENLHKNLIYNLYTLSRSVPSTLILAGLPTAFVDECMHAGLFVSDTTTIAQKSTNIFRRSNSNSHRGVNWSLHETVVLLDSKKREDEASALANKVLSAEERWESIASHCVENDVHKSAQQCMHKWEKLSTQFKKIFDYERRQPTHKKDSYWNLSAQRRKERSLPLSFNRDVFRAMVDKFRIDRIDSLGDGAEGQLIKDETFQMPQPLPHPSEMPEEDLPFISSEQQPFWKKRKQGGDALATETTHKPKHLMDSFERIEDEKLQVARLRLAYDQKANASICSSIAEIASAIRSIVDAIHKM
ncbi:hypothetical protein O6H91_05G115900 [Diphasiastrum complanatum]|uniref:Uncharacterized protein n=1 Tax=Diphasiastrum complanatum TaxID=34168 RepID=A0ACC2DST1_DIPCM|nr:hypothetical protein O6H91_05G115900 [Diphasiastrum complanatum]